MQDFLGSKNLRYSGFPGFAALEIKTAVAIAADVALNSSMLYETQIDMDEFLRMFE